MQPSISVAICSRNRADALRNFVLPSLKLQHEVPFEVILVSDGSTDDTDAVAEEFRGQFANFTYVRIDPKDAKGLCAARNKALDAAKAPYIFYTDDDARLSPALLKNIIDTFEANPRAVAVVGKVFVRDSDELESHGWLHGVNMSFRSCVLRLLRFDDEMHFMGYIYYDELDLRDRLRKFGFLTVVNDNVIIRHYPAPAPYRQSTRIRYHINHVYSQAKNRSILTHYASLLISPLLLLVVGNKQERITPFLKKHPWMHDVAAYHWLWVKDLVSRREFGKLTKAYWLILTEIPIKAYNRRQKEERRLKDLSLAEYRSGSTADCENKIS